MIKDDIINYIDVKNKLNELCFSYFNTVKQKNQYFNSWSIDELSLVIKIKYHQYYYTFNGNSFRYGTIYVTLENLLEFEKCIKQFDYQKDITCTEDIK